MLNNDIVLVRCPVRADLKFLLVGAVTVDSDGVGEELVRTKDVEFQVLRVALSSSANIDLVAFCNDRAGRIGLEERTLQVDGNGCILRVGQFDCRLTGCSDRLDGG